MARKSTKAKTAKSDAPESGPSSQVAYRRKTPLWHRTFLRHLSTSGNKSESARHCGISYRQVIRTERAKPRFRKAVIAALRIAEEHYAHDLERMVEDMALNGVEQKIFKGTQYVGSYTRWFPNLTRHVLDTVAKKYRVRADAKVHALKSRGGESVSNVQNNLNVSINPAIANDPVVRDLLLALSDRMTEHQTAIDVSPPPEPPSDDV